MIKVFKYLIETITLNLKKCGKGYRVCLYVRNNSLLKKYTMQQTGRSQKLRFSCISELLKIFMFSSYSLLHHELRETANHPCVYKKKEITDFMWLCKFSPVQYEYWSMIILILFFQKYYQLH